MKWNDADTKAVLGSIFFTVISTVCLISIIVGLKEKENARLKKRESLIKSRYGTEQLEILREILTSASISGEKKEELLDKIVTKAVDKKRTERLLRREIGVKYENLLHDLYLASEKWGIKDEKKLNKIRQRLLVIAEEEIELNMGRYFAEVGISEMKKESDRLYKARLDAIEAFLPDDKKAAYKDMREAVSSIYGLEVQKNR